MDLVSSPPWCRWHWWHHLSSCSLICNDIQPHPPISTVVPSRRPTKRRADLVDSYMSPLEKERDWFISGDPYNTQNHYLLWVCLEATLFHTLANRSKRPLSILFAWDHCWCLQFVRNPVALCTSHCDCVPRWKHAFVRRVILGSIEWRQF